MLNHPPVRPDNALLRIKTIFEQHSEIIKLVPRKRLTWTYKGRQQLYFIIDGQLSVLRASDGLLIVTVAEPHLFGIAEMIQPVRSHLLRSESPTTLLRIDAEYAQALIEEHSLWKDIASVLAYHTAYLLHRDSIVLQQRTYSIVRNHLQEMMLLQEEGRMKLYILNYIQERTHLSRSSILNIVSTLQKGDYLHCKRGGYILSLNTLPEQL